MSIEIRPILPDELTAWFEAVQTGFHEKKGTAAEKADFRRPFMEFPRTLGAFDGSRVVGTFRSFRAELTVPGGTILAADAVTAVTVLPTHRRRGILTSMMAADLGSAAERGEPLAILIASEWPIYGRYGFGPATDHTTLTIDRRRAALARGGEGAVDLVDVATLRERAPAIFDRFRAGRPGAIDRPPRWWDWNIGLREVPARQKWLGWQAILTEPDGDETGYVRYHVDDKWEGHDFDSTLVVDELVAATPGAYARLWRFVTEIDLIARIRADDRPVDEPIRYLLVDGQAAHQSLRGHMLWVRVLDPVAALSGRCYMLPGRLVLELIDRDGFANGRFAIDGSPDHASCHPTSESADIRLPVWALGAVYLGGPRLRDLAAAGLVEEERPGGIERADLMFGWRIEPWCTTWF